MIEGIRFESRLFWQDLRRSHLKWFEWNDFGFRNDFSHWSCKSLTLFIFWQSNVCLNSGTLMCNRRSSRKTRKSFEDSRSLERSKFRQTLERNTVQQTKPAEQSLRAHCSAYTTEYFGYCWIGRISFMQHKKLSRHSLANSQSQLAIHSLNPLRQSAIAIHCDQPKPQPVKKTANSLAIRPIIDQL